MVRGKIGSAERDWNGARKDWQRGERLLRSEGKIGSAERDCCDPKKDWSGARERLVVVRKEGMSGDASVKPDKILLKAVKDQVGAN